MDTFRPRLEILPPAQQRLWPALAQVPKNFVLYGGTGLALRLGHRSSVDFDFFTSLSFLPSDLLKSIPVLADAKVLQNVSQTLTVELNRGGPIKLSFFGALPLGRVGNPQLTDDHVIYVASLLDLAGTKAAVVTQRAESKDYLDLLALVKTGISIGQAMAAAAAIYGRQYNAAITLKSLSYFGDGDLHKLTPEQQKELTGLAAKEDLLLPHLPRISESLAG